MTREVYRDGQPCWRGWKTCLSSHVNGCLGCGRVQAKGRAILQFYGRPAGRFGFSAFRIVRAGERDQLHVEPALCARTRRA